MILMKGEENSVEKHSWSKQVENFNSIMLRSTEGAMEALQCLETLTQGKRVEKLNMAAGRLYRV